MTEVKYHRLFGTQERIDLQLLIQLFDKFKDDIMINANIRMRVERLTEPKELTIYEQHQEKSV